LARCRPRSCGWEADSGHGSIRLGQVDAHASARGARPADVGLHHARRHAARPAERRRDHAAPPQAHWFRVPVLQPAADAEGRRERGALGDGGARPEVITVTLRGLAGRKLRASLTAFAIVLGVAMISGGYVLTDTINKAFDTIFQQSYKKADVVIAGKAAFQN